MADAHCSCGALSLTLRDAPSIVVACHCLDCQRRTGAPFGVGAFYLAESVTVSGRSKEYARSGASGGMVRNQFCPECGATVFWRADALPSMIGVAVGALADPAAPAPARSVFERSRHPWIRITGDVQRFEAGSVPRAPPREPGPT